MTKPNKFHALTYKNNSLFIHNDNKREKVFKRRAYQKVYNAVLF